MIRNIIFSILFLSNSTYAQLHGNAGGGDALVIGLKKCQNFERRLLTLEEEFLKQHHKTMDKYSDFTALLVKISMSIDLEKLTNGNLNGSQRKYLQASCKCNFEDILSRLLLEYQNESMISQCPGVLKERHKNIDLIKKILNEK